MQKIKILLSIMITFSLLALSCAGENEDVPELKTENDEVSYSIGVQLGTGLRNNNLEINIDILSRALKDAFEGKPLKFTENEIMEILSNFQSNMNLAAASAFLAENAKKPGVTTLPDSVQYEIIKEGTGPHPSTQSKVKAHYRGTLIDGTVFDSSYIKNEPLEFTVGQMIPGWIEVVPLMKVGAHWKVYIPPEQGYGERGSGRIPPNTLLIFEIELLEIVE